MWLSQPPPPLGGGCEGDMRLWSGRRHQSTGRAQGRRRWLQWCQGGLSVQFGKGEVRGLGGAIFRSSGCWPVFSLCTATNSASRRYPLSTRSAAETVSATGSGIVRIWWIDLQFAAARHQTAPLGAILISTPILSRVSTDALLCCFSATVCVPMLCGVPGLAEKLPPAVAEAAAKSFACLRAMVVRTVACGCFKRVWLSEAFGSSIWDVCCCCVRADVVLNVLPGSKAAASSG
eukprot:COSAG02_NODE_3768_length_6264_cov_5.702676_2_plen_233_part_00